MSQTEKSSPNLFKALCVVLVITTIGGLAGFAYYYGQSTAENAKNSDLAVENARLRTRANNLTAQISQNTQTIGTLKEQISTLNSRIAYLQEQLNGNATLVAQLRSQVASLQSQLDTLNTAKVVVVFTWTATRPINIGICPDPIFCVHIDGRATVTNVAWANLGTLDARNVLATATFYASTDGTGPALCSVSGPLGRMGTVAGHSLDMQADLTVSNSCATDNSLAQSATASVTWS